MKKVILVPVLLGVMGMGAIIAVGGGNIVGSADSAKGLTKSEIEKKTLAEVDGKITEIELDLEGSLSVYEVEVVTQEAEYDLKFNAITGELLKKTKDYHDDDDDYFKKSNLNTSTNASNDTSSNLNTNPSTNASTSTKTSITTNRATQDDDQYDDDDDDRYDD